MDVSVIIPTYNRFWCLPKAIASCENTECNTEIIVVDDGSTDGTWEWLENQKKNENLVILKQKNQGQTWAINYGTSIARGEYIRFLDSDDFLCPGIIDKQLEKARHCKAQLVYSRVDTLFNKAGKIVEYPDPLWSDFLEVQLGNQYGRHFLGMLFHRTLVEKVPRRPDFAYREDRMFLLEVGLLEPKIAQVPGCAGYWVQHNQQMQANYRGLKSVATNWQHFNIYKRILGELEKQEKLTQQRARSACSILWTLAHWIAYTHLDEACDVVSWIYELDPEFQPPNPGLLGKMYSKIGFENTERVLKLRRILLKLIPEIRRD